MSTLRTTTLKHSGSNALDNLVFSNAGESRFCPNSSFGRAALYVDGQTNRVGVNNETPGVALDVDGAINATGNAAFGGTLSATGNVVFDGDVTLNGTVGDITSTGKLNLGYDLAARVSARPTALDENCFYAFEGDAAYTGALFKAQYNQTLAGSDAKLWEGVGVVSGSFTSTSFIYPDGSALFTGANGNSHVFGIKRLNNADPSLYSLAVDGNGNVNIGQGNITLSYTGTATFASTVTAPTFAGAINLPAGTSFITANGVAAISSGTPQATITQTTLPAGTWIIIASWDGTHSLGLGQANDRQEYTINTSPATQGYIANPILPTFRANLDSPSNQFVCARGSLSTVATFTAANTTLYLYGGPINITDTLQGQLGGRISAIKIG